MRYEDIVALKSTISKPDNKMGRDYARAASGYDQGIEDVYKEKTTARRAPTSNSTATPTNQSAFQQWYKKSFGSDFVEGSEFVKPDSMGITDWLIGQNYYNQYRAEKNANANYAAGTAEAQKAKDLGDQEAYIASQKVLQYLKMANQASGIQGVGGTDYVNAMNNYQSSLASNKEGLRGEMAALAAQRDQAIASGNQEYAAAISELMREKESEEENTGTIKGSEVYAGIQEMYSSFASGSSDGETIAADQYQNLVDEYEKYKGEMDETTRWQIEFYLDHIPHATDDGGSSDGLGSFVTGEKNSESNEIVVNGTTYRLRGEDVGSTEGLAWPNNPPRNGDVVYSFPFYIMYYNGKGYRVDKR